jgi:hypothetical protein
MLSCNAGWCALQTDRPAEHACRCCAYTMMSTYAVALQCNTRLPMRHKVTKAASIWVMDIDRPVQCSINTNYARRTATHSTGNLFTCCNTKARLLMWT